MDLSPEILIYLVQAKKKSEDHYFINKNQKIEIPQVNPNVHLGLTELVNKIISKPH